MGHVDVCVLYLEEQVSGVLQADNVVVNVAMHCTQRLEFGQSLGRFNIAYIARVPQLVNVFEKIEKLRNEGAVRV